MFDLFSQKLHKHGLDTQLKLFRMNLDNVTPYLGRFLVAPQYLYVSSKDGAIKEIKTMRSLGDQLNCTTFLEDVTQLSKLPIKDKIRIDSRKHILLYAGKQNLADEFEPDADLSASSPSS